MIKINLITRSILLALLLISFNSPAWADLEPHILDAPLTEEEKTFLQEEIDKYTKLLETDCDPVTSALESLATSIQSYLEAYNSYYDNLNAQQDMIIGATRQYSTSKIGITDNSGEEGSSGPTLMDTYMAMVKEAKELKLFTEKPTSYVDPDLAARCDFNWVDELNWAYKEWEDRGKKSPDTKHEVYFFDQTKELVNLRFDLQERQKEFHKTWREERQKAVARQSEMEEKLHELGLKVTHAMARTDEIVTSIKGQIAKISQLAKSGEYEHCFGYPKEESGELTDQLLWVAFAKGLKALPIPPQFVYPDLSKIPATLPVILLKADGFEHYWRVRKMFEDQAMVDLERAGYFMTNMYDNTADILSVAATNIYETGEFLVKAGVMTADTAAAIGTAGLSYLKGSVTGDYDFDPIGSLSRTEELLNKLGSVQKAMASFCNRNDPFEASDNALYVSYCAMAGIVNVSQKLSEFLDSTGKAWTGLDQSAIADAEDLSQLTELRDLAASIEKGSKDFNFLVGFLGSELLMEFATAKILDKALPHLGKLDALKQKDEILKGLDNAMKSADNLENAARKIDDIRDAVKTGGLSSEEGSIWLDKVYDIVKKDRKIFEKNLSNYSPETRNTMKTAYNQKLENFLKTAKNVEDLDDLSKGKTKGMGSKAGDGNLPEASEIGEPFDLDELDMDDDFFNDPTGRGTKGSDDPDVDEDFFGDSSDKGTRDANDPELGGGGEDVLPDSGGKKPDRGAMKIDVEYQKNAEMGEELGTGYYAKAFNNTKNPDEVLKIQWTEKAEDIESFERMVERSKKGQKILDDVGIDHAKITGEGKIEYEGRVVDSFTQEKVDSKLIVDKMEKGSLSAEQQEAIVRGIRKLNDKGYVMGDLKPDNIYLKEIDGQWEMGVVDLDWIDRPKTKNTLEEISELQYQQAMGRYKDPETGEWLDSADKLGKGLITSEMGGGGSFGGGMADYLDNDYAQMILNPAKWDIHQLKKAATLNVDDAKFLDSPVPRGPTPDEIAVQKRDARIAAEARHLRHLEKLQHNKQMLQSMCDRYLKAIAQGASEKELEALIKKGFHCDYSELKENQDNSAVQ